MSSHSLRWTRGQGWMDGWEGARPSPQECKATPALQPRFSCCCCSGHCLILRVSCVTRSLTFTFSLSLPRTPVLASCDRSPLHLAVYPAIPLMSYRAVPTPPCHWEMEGGLFALTLSLMSDRDYLLISFAPSTVLSECLSGERERVCVCVCACECGTEVV